MSSYHQYESDARQHRYPSCGGESIGSTKIRSSETVASDESRSVNYLANHLKQTASFDYNSNRSSYYNEKENESSVQHEYEKASRNRDSRESRNRDSADRERVSLENNYSRAMSQMNRYDYGPVYSNQEKASKQVEKRNSRSNDVVPSRKTRNNAMKGDRRNSQSSVISQVSSASTSKPVPIHVKKRSVSKKAPSEETIAIFGAYGVTGQYFLQRAMEAGYNIQAMILPGMEMEDVACSKSLRLITGTLNEVEKVREVVENATYVVCLLNDCEDENFSPPIGNAEDDGNYQFNNLNFMHNLVPILEHSKTCRVLLYEVSESFVSMFLVNELRPKPMFHSFFILYFKNRHLLCPRETREHHCLALL